MRLIAESQDRAVRSVNTVLIDLYWTVGEIISQKIATAEWGDAVVPKLAAYIARTQPGLRGFTSANLFGCGSFTRHTGRTKKSRRWCDKFIPKP